MVEEKGRRGEWSVYVDRRDTKGIIIKQQDAVQSKT